MRASTSFHNTIGARGQELTNYDARANSQEQIILKFFRQNVGRMFTPSEIHQKLFTPIVPLTSVRRAITNLTEAGAITKTDIKYLIVDHVRPWRKGGGIKPKNLQCLCEACNSIKGGK